MKLTIRQAHRSAALLTRRQQATAQAGALHLLVHHAGRCDAGASRRPGASGGPSGREVGRRKTLGDAPLTLDAKRRLVRKHQAKFGAPLLCDLLQMERSSFYDTAVREPDDGVPFRESEGHIAVDEAEVKLAAVPVVELDTALFLLVHEALVLSTL
ncbi:MAG: hypothetical protein U0791_26255 [Gemmataceae bacterium]